jgi:isoquinoline 1-oxidoreductase alpha subunit
MHAAELFERNSQATRDEIVAHMNAVLCRCGTYTRIVSAIQRAAKEQ